MYTQHVTRQKQTKNKKDGYRQQNVRQRQKLISIIDYDVYDFLLVRRCNYSSICTICELFDVE